MHLRSSARAWGSVAKTFHWGMALLILAMLVLGWVAATWPRSPTKLSLFYWHKSTGILLLALVVLRIAWRVLEHPPETPAGSTRREKRLAKGVHLGLYGLMLAMPLSGWVINSAANYPLKVFGLFALPKIVATNRAAQHLAQDAHLILFWALAALLVLHVAAALQHHFVRRNDVLIRMLPGHRLHPGPKSSP